MLFIQIVLSGYLTLTVLPYQSSCLPDLKNPWTDWVCHKNCMKSVKTRKLKKCDITSKSFDSKKAAKACGVSQIEIQNCISVDTCQEFTINKSSSLRPNVTKLELEEGYMNLKIDCQNELKTRTDNELKELTGIELPVEWHFRGRIISDLEREKQGLLKQV